MKCRPADVSPDGAFVIAKKMAQTIDADAWDKYNNADK